MGQRHVTRAEFVELAKRGEIATDLMPALDPDQRGDAAGLVDSYDFVGGAGEREVLWVGFDHPLDDVDLLDRVADGGVACDLRGDIDRPELPADAAGMKPRHVGHQRLGPLVGAARQALYLQAVILAQLLGDVVVAVDQRRRLEDAVDPRLDLGIDPLG